MSDRQTQLNLPMFALGVVAGWIASAMMRAAGRKAPASTRSRVAKDFALPELFSDTLGHMRADLRAVGVNLPFAFSQESDAQHLDRQHQASIASLWSTSHALAIRAAQDAAHDYSADQARLMASIVELTRQSDDALLADRALAAALNIIDSQAGILSSVAKEMPSTTDVVKTTTKAVDAANAIVKVFPV